MENTLKTAEFELIAANYDDMFAKIIKLVPKEQSWVKGEIQWAKTHLKRQDRITWWLRYVRVALLESLLRNQGNLKGDQELQAGHDALKKMYEAEYRSLTSRTGIQEKLPNTGSLSLLQNKLEHFLSLPTAAIQNLVWDKQAPPDLIKEFEEYEDKWKAEVAEGNRGLEAQEDDEIVLQFQDGWAWWKLSRGYCSEEAKAMGHCGNVNGKYNSDERILSLRKAAKGSDGKERWAPSLTFILDGNGLLGEMKGRGNEKPSDKYHPYIVGLLERTDIVKGIKGGGYLPSHNFSLADLDSSTQNRLAEINPNLQSAKRQYRQLKEAKKNSSQFPEFVEFVNRVQGAADVEGTWDDTVNGWVKEEWATPGEFIESDLHNNISTAYKKMELDIPTNGYEGNQIMRETVDRLKSQDIKMIFDSLESDPKIQEWLQKASSGTVAPQSRDLLLNFINSTDPTIHAVAYYTKQKIYNVWKAGMTESVRQDMAEEIQNALLEELHSRQGMGLKFTDKGENFWKSPVKMYFPLYYAIDKADGTGPWSPEEEAEGGGFGNDEYGDNWETDFHYRDPLMRINDTMVRNKIDEAKKQLDEDERENVDRMYNDFHRGRTEQFINWVESVVPGAFDGAKGRTWDVEEARKQLYTEFQQMDLPFNAPQTRGHGAALLQKGASFAIIAANYEEMFNGIKPILEECEGLRALPKWTLVPQEISWAKTTLKKQDRIVWWMRWFRLSLLDAMVAALRYVAEPLNVVDERAKTEMAKYAPSFQKAQKLQENEQRAMGSRIDRQLVGLPGIDISSFLRMHSMYQHMLSLPVQAIQNTIWDKQTPDQLRKSFQEAERIWQEETKGLLQPQKEPNEQNEVDEVFIPFQDGWAWWKLSRAYCSEEAKAMGHCGNVVGQDKTDERILSLRKPVQRGKDTYYEPHLTFILEPNGKLGEMKGKANAKPATQYHPYIVALLEDQRIKGIRGGGYAPERNFAMADLPKETQDAIAQKNPGMMALSRRLQLLQQGSVPGQANMFPTTPEQWASLRKDVEEILWPEDDSEETPDFSNERNGWLTNYWANVDELVDSYGNDTAKWISKRLSGGGDDYFDYGEGSSYTDVLNSLNSKQETMVKEFIATEFPELVQEWKEEKAEEEEVEPQEMNWYNDVDLAEFIEKYEPGDVQNDLLRASETGNRYGAEGAMYKALASAVEEFSVQDTGEQIILPRYKSKDGKEGITWDSKVIALLPLPEGTALADKGEPWSYWKGSDGSEAGEITVSEPYNGWSDWDEDAFNEDLMESFGHPTHGATVQKEREDMAKKRPDLIAKRDANGAITGWDKNPKYKGPPVIDEKGNYIKYPKKKPVKKTKTKTKARGANASKQAFERSEFNQTKNELLAALQTLPYADEIKVFGSMAYGATDHDPRDIDLYIDLRGKDKHPAWRDLMALARKYYGYLDPFIIADAGIMNGKPVFDLWARNDHATGWIHSRNKKKMLKNMSDQGKPLSLIKPLEMKQAARHFTPQQIENEARCYENQKITGEPGHGYADEYTWAQDDALPVNKIEGEPSMWTPWLAQEKTWAAEGGRPEQYYEKMEEWWTKHPDEHIIVVLENGVYYIWEGNHRVAIAKAHDMETVPAFVGTPRQNKTGGIEIDKAYKGKAPDVATTLHIEVPSESRGHFWEEPPEGNLEFWAFSDRPKAFVDEKIVFTFDKKPVAEARILRIEDPGHTKCDQTGRYEKHHKVFWSPNDFVKLGSSGTVTLADLYPNDELTDENEGIGLYVSQFGQMEFDSIVNHSYTVQTLPAEKVKQLLAGEGQTVQEVFTDFAEPWQKRLVKQKTQKFDQNRIIVLNGNRVIDGNHHAVAAIQLNQPVKYIDLANLPEGKTAAVPEDLQEMNTPVSKEYDAVRYVISWYQQNNTQQLSWKDFQKTFQQFAARYNTLFTQIRKNKPQVALADLQEWLQEQQYAEPTEPEYNVTYDRYNEPEHSFRDVEQLVIQLNRGARAEQVLAEDPMLKQYLSMVGQSSGMAGHPAGMETVGWLRVDFVDENLLLVDEIQSDLVNSITQAKAYLTSETFDDFLAQLGNEKLRDLAREKLDARTYSQMRQQMMRAGYSLDKLEEMKDKIVSLFENWTEWAVASVLEIARRHNIKQVAIHTAESIMRRDPSVEGDKIKIFYDNIAKSFGFKKQQLDIEGGVGTFWVRTASQRFNTTPKIAVRGYKIDAHQSGDTIWIDWFEVPEPNRGKGQGTRYYMEWESKLPKSVKLLRLFAAETAAKFWESVGFSFVYDTEQGDETDKYMWKGINGNPTPPALTVERDEPEGYGIEDEPENKQSALYHGNETGEATPKPGKTMFFAEDPAYAERYGKVSEFDLAPGTKILDARTPDGAKALADIRSKAEGSRRIDTNPFDSELPLYNFAQEVQYYAKPLGYDGAVFSELTTMGGNGIRSVGVWNTSKLHKLAAVRQTYYHGTDIKNLRPILSEGLIPEGKQKSWADDPNAGLTAPSRQAYGGTYLTRNLMTAIGAPRNGKSNPDFRMVIVIVEAQPNSLFLDEDSIVGILDSPFGNYNRDTSEMSVGESFMMTLPNAPESMKEILQNQQTAYVENVVKNIKHQLETNTLTMAPDLEKRVRELLPGVFLASLKRRVSHAYKSDERRTKEDGYDARTYDFKRAYRRIMGDRVEVPAKETIIPTPQDGEAIFRNAAEQLTRTLRTMLRIQQKGGWSFQNARATEPIGYSGSNRITGVLEILDGRGHYIEYNDPDGYEGKSRMTPIVVHYGSVPDDFKQQWKERVGNQIYWLKPGQTPPASTYVKPEPKPEVQEQEAEPEAVGATASKTADRENEEGFWAGEGNAASGILPVCPATGNVGLAMRSKHVDYPGVYGTIGGAIKKGMSPSGSAKVELKEETGYNGGINLIPAYTFATGKGFKYHNFIGVVQSEFSLNPGAGSSAGIKHEDETDSLDWVPFAEVMEDIKTNSSDYHPGFIKFLNASQDAIERALGIQKQAAEKDPNLVAFMQDLWGNTYQNPMNNRERVWAKSGPNADKAAITCSIFNGRIHMELIRTIEKGQGFGSEALDFLCKLADKHGVGIELDVERPTGTPKGEGLTNPQLKSWYKRHGFKPGERMSSNYLVREPADKPLKLGPNMKIIPMKGQSKKEASGEKRMPFAIWVAKQARPTQQKIDLLKQRYKFDDQQLEQIIQADPTEKDYVQWLGAQVAAKTVKLPEDTAKIKEQLTTFTKLKRSPQFMESKDIQTYTPATLYQMLQKNAQPEAYSQKEQERQTVEKGTTVIYNQGEYRIYKIPEEHASESGNAAAALCSLSGGTNWCTSQNEYAEQYLGDGPSYVMFYKGSAYAQLHPESDQFMDRTDDSLVEAIITRVPDGSWKRVTHNLVIDPVAWQFLQLLAPLAPDVKRWMSKIEDPATIDAIGSEMDIWQRVKLAIAQGKRLPPEVEEEFLSKPSGMKTPPELVNTYIATVIKERVPRWESAIINFWGDIQVGRLIEISIDYIHKVLKARWPAFETAVGELKSLYDEAVPLARYCADYGVRIPKVEESLLYGSGARGTRTRGVQQEAINYAAKLIPEGETFRTALERELLNVLTPESVAYAVEVKKGRWPELEDKLLKGGDDRYDWKDLAATPLYAQCLLYAEKVIGGRWPEFEEKILGAVSQTPWLWSFRHPPEEVVEKYTGIIGGRWPEFEKFMLNTELKPEELGKSYMRVLATYIHELRHLGTKWPEGETELERLNAFHRGDKKQKPIY